MDKLDRGSIGRIVALLISLLAYFGVNVPEELHEYIVGAVMLIVIGISAWRNNYLSKRGRAQKEVLKRNNLTK
jgi:SPP1 family holin